jgi:hypothetical protein
MEVVPFVVRLESRGLIFEIFEGSNVRVERWDGSKRSLDTIWRNKWYVLTPIGLKFCEFLSGNQ